MRDNFDGNSTVKVDFERAAALMRTGDVPAVEALCRDALERFPGDGNLLCMLGAALIRQRRPGEAEKPLREAIERFPQFGKAHEELGNALLAQNRLEDAAACLERAVELDPDNVHARFKLEKILAALRAPARVHQHGVSDVEVLERNPTDPHALRLVAQDAQRQGDTGEAIVLLKKAVAADAEFVIGWLDLGKLYADREDYAEALDAARRASELEPLAPLPQLRVAEYSSHLGRHDEAIEAYSAGLSANPGHRDCLIGLGHMLRTVGRHDEAVRAYRETIERHPSDAEAYWSLANMKSVRFRPAEVDAMHRHLSFDQLEDEARAQLLFALGKASEDDADYKRAFRFYREGNSIRRGLESYDPVATQTLHDRLIACFDAAFFDARRGSGAADPDPIFVVGLPRSGSTLIEQILASHENVQGTRELPDLERIVAGLDYPEALAGLDAAGFAELARRYLGATERYRGGAGRERSERFTDKMPTNFRHVGLIHLMLPNARIIDARRHPLDSCLSSYRQLFARGHPYTYDLFELGEYYVEYRRLMDHWHAVLPGRVLDVQYEHLVAEPEAGIRRLLEYCGLDWDDRCLSFYETERAIESASSEQVRQPIYWTSVNTWRRYEPWIEDLTETLEPVLRMLPSGDRPASIG